MVKKGVRNTRRGSALVGAAVAVSLLAGFSISMLMVAGSVQSEQKTDLESAQALYAAQAAVGVAATELKVAVEQGQEPPVSVGSAGEPLALGGGSAFATIVEEADGSFTVTSFGNAADGGRRALEVTLVPGGPGAFSRALFAGNESEDSSYTLDLGGVGNQADQIHGDVYSANDVLIEGDASVMGDIVAGGTIYGGAGEVGVQLPMPDLTVMDYENNHDFNVEELFTDATWQWDNAGGSAWQVPEENPAHIFRKNPNDRNSTNNATVKDDYYLEDPYEPVRRDRRQDGSDAFPVSLTGINGKPGPSGTDAVYFIDGNLWIHNKPSYSFQFVAGAGEDVRVTFVVKGNITFSDNIFYEDAEQDGLVFIAIGDEDVEDSGNIYFGDPVGGTLEYMDSFMYAENDFIDTNMNAAGSLQVEVNGTMSAGNHVAIERDYGDAHSRLTVTADLRLDEGTLEMPGIPPTLSGGAGLSMGTWREVAYDPRP